MYLLVHYIQTFHQGRVDLEIEIVSLAEVILDINVASTDAGAATKASTEF